MSGKWLLVLAVPALLALAACGGGEQVQPTLTLTPAATPSPTPTGDVQAPTETPTETPGPTVAVAQVTFVASGDVMLGRSIGDGVRRRQRNHGGVGGAVRERLPCRQFEMMNRSRTRDAGSPAGSRMTTCLGLTSIALRCQS